MQQPTGQPNWPTPQPIPPPIAGRRPGGWKRGLIITALAVVGVVAGGMIGSSFVLVNEALGVVLMMVGLWVGLALGIWFGVKLAARPRPPIDPGQYPNQTFRRV